MNKTLYILILASVFIAGCASSDKTEMQNKDLLRITNFVVTPSTTVAPGDVITIRMKLENVGQENVSFVKSDASGYSPITKDDELNGILYDYCSSIYTGKKLSLISKGYSKDASGNYFLKPSGSMYLEWTVNAPDETKIGKMKHECNFKFQINYQGTAKTYTYVYFSTPDEKTQRTYTSKDMNLKGENVANFGPVYINFEAAQDQPVKGNSNSILNNKWTFYATIRNVGEGIGKVSSDTAGKFKIQLPDESLTAGLNDCGAATINQDCLDFCKNAATPSVLEYAGSDTRLKLYTKQSSRFSCTLAAPKVGIIDPYRFISSAGYIYSMDKEVKITTVPER